MYYGCQERPSKHTTIKFHRIPNAKTDPKKRELAAQWLHNIGTLDPSTNKVWNVETFNFTKYKKVCSKHFSPDSYLDTTVYESVMGKSCKKKTERNSNTYFVST